MQIGSRVISKKIGVPVVGTVVAMYDGLFYKYLYARQNNMFGGMLEENFANEFDNSEQMCVVVFDQPVRFNPVKDGTQLSKMEFLLQPAITQQVFGVNEIEELSDEKFKTQKTHSRVESE